LVFQTGAYFAALGEPSFFPRVTVEFEIAERDEHYHVPLLLSPYGFTAYRGS
jgi:5-hydroxyisourate hydrolase